MLNRRSFLLGLGISAPVAIAATNLMKVQAIRQSSKPVIHTAWNLAKGSANLVWLIPTEEGWVRRKYISELPFAQRLEVKNV